MLVRSESRRKKNAAFWQNRTCPAEAEHRHRRRLIAESSYQQAH